MINQTFFGYHLRVPLTSVREQWKAERRERFLLNKNVEIPLSADFMVWPILNHSDIASKLFDDFSSEAFSSPNGMGFYNLIAESPDIVIQKEGVLIGISIEHEYAKYFEAMHSIVPRPLNSKMKFIGFDVCDEWLTSGLMNCGVSAETHRSLSDEFSKELNSYGLFNSLENAEFYSKTISTIVSEHGPFFPIGIYALF